MKPHDDDKDRKDHIDEINDKLHEEQKKEEEKRALNRLAGNINEMVSGLERITKSAELILLKTKGKPNRGIITEDDIDRIHIGLGLMGDNDINWFIDRI